MHCMESNNYDNKRQITKKFSEVVQQSFTKQAKVADWVGVAADGKYWQEY